VPIPSQLKVEMKEEVKEELPELHIRPSNYHSEDIFHENESESVSLADVDDFFKDG
jgi:hypothetical protein